MAFSFNRKSKKRKTSSQVPGRYRYRAWYRALRKTNRTFFSVTGFPGRNRTGHPGHESHQISCCALRTATLPESRRGVMPSPRGRKVREPLVWLFFNFEITALSPQPFCGCYIDVTPFSFGGVSWHAKKSDKGEQSGSRHGLCGTTISVVSYQVVRPGCARAATPTTLLQS